MRVMVIIKANAESEAGVMPSEKVLADMGKFNEELVNAGIMLEGEGLHPTSKAKRIKFSKGQRLVTDGPFAETREQLGGYFLVDASDLDEALSIAERIPMAKKGTIEVRPVVELPNLPQ